MTRVELSEVQAVRTLRVKVVDGPDAGTSCSTAAETMTIGTAATNDLVLTEQAVSRFHVELKSCPNGVLVVDCGSKNGIWLASTRIDRAWIALRSVLKIGGTRLQVQEGSDAVIELHSEDAFGRVRGRTPVMRRLMARFNRITTTDAPVLLVGEVGTGKGLIARELHEQSDRTAGPFVTFDCGAMAPGSQRGVLFGQERGALPSADKLQMGALERANEGTLLLDHLGELPADMQTQLLSVLENGTLRRVGGDVEVPVDVRIISISAHDLRADVNAGRFRADLYYRLAAVAVRVPPLRERLDDILLLAESFLREQGFEGLVDEVIPPTTLDRLLVHHWPGNVLELRNLVLGRLAVGESVHPTLSPDSTAPLASLPAHLLKRPFKEARTAMVDEFEAQYLEHVMRLAEGDVPQAARLAHLGRAHLVSLLRRHGLG